VSGASATGHHGSSAAGPPAVSPELTPLSRAVAPRSQAVAATVGRRRGRRIRSARYS